MVGRLVVWLVGWSVGRTVNWSVGQSDTWSINQSIAPRFWQLFCSWLVSQSVAWLVDWSVGWLFFWAVRHMIVSLTAARWTPLFLVLPAVVGERERIASEGQLRRVNRVKSVNRVGKPEIAIRMASENVFSAEDRVHGWGRWWRNVAQMA